MPFTWYARHIMDLERAYRRKVRGRRRALLAGAVLVALAAALAALLRSQGW